MAKSYGKATNKLGIILLLVLFLSSSIIALYFYDRSNYYKKSYDSMRLSYKLQNEKENNFLPISNTQPTVRKSLPSTINRISNNNYLDWKTLKVIEGFTIKYPTNWFLAGPINAPSQIQNWDPVSVTRPGPLTGNQSKWDLSFYPYKLINIDDLFSKSDIQIDKVEKTKTENDLDCYFVIGTSSLFGNESIRVPIITAYIVKGDQYYIWNGIYAGESNLELLKEIVESIK